MWAREGGRERVVKRDSGHIGQWSNGRAGERVDSTGGEGEGGEGQWSNGVVVKQGSGQTGK